MTRTTFSGREIVKALARHGFEPAGRTGSHVQLRYEHPETDDVRTVTVPMKSDIPTGTLQAIAKQSGAKDFYSWCEWIEQTL
ncbi:type II toxin-antitoxin system HicA family toxin [Haloferax volcanii]|uniref:Type II toxin-antitoxin system HicA family toxin n=1 Tax=Haloferax volcanii TaxID=2246 RepID=A0A558G7I2_HALVO|nr:type II toxin-antitoxin system HicA family toxin [Haloferax volcanii]TVT93727.1 type II toxin-antitoxin system HicA family toxin [Haloferax volcanii]